MRFGTVDTFFSLNPDELRIGRNVANHEFFKALLTHGAYEAYHVFLPDIAHLEVFRQRLSMILPDPVLRRRVQPTVLVALKESLSELEFTVFHQSDFTRYLPYLAPLRDRYAHRAFPITGVTHSLNTYLMPQRYLQLGLARLAPFDAIITTSLAGQEVVRRGFEQMSTRLQQEFGLELTLPARLAHIPLGIDDGRFLIPPKSESRRKLGLPPQDVLLLYLGRLSARTKLDLFPLIHGLAERWQKGALTRVKLVLAGGSEASELSALHQLLAQLQIRDQVIFKPDFDDQDKTRLFSAADLFVSLSDNLQETFGLSVVEAMAAGVVPIVSDFDGYRELVQHRHNGVRIPTLWGPPMPTTQDLEPLLAQNHAFFMAQTFAVDLDATLEAIQRLAEDAGERTRMGQAARASAQALRWSALIPRYEALWAELKQLARISERPPPPAPQPLELEVFPIFSHYPSTLLSADLKLACTPRGMAALEGAALPSAHRDMNLLLHPPLVQALLAGVATGPATVAELYSIGVGLEVASGTTGYHLLWLLKYGLLRTATPLLPRDTPVPE